jgi:hypothetical protein
MIVVPGAQTTVVRTGNVVVVAAAIAQPADGPLISRHLSSLIRRTTTTTLDRHRINHRQSTVVGGRHRRGSMAVMIIDTAAAEHARKYPNKQATLTVQQQSVGVQTLDP